MNSYFRPLLPTYIRTDLFDGYGHREMDTSIRRIDDRAPKLSLAIQRSVRIRVLIALPTYDTDASAMATTARCLITKLGR